MSRKAVRNGEPDFRSITMPGICKKSGEKAEITTYFRGSVECKTDLQKTYRFKGYKCSLQEENGCSDPACMDICPYIQKEYL